MLKTWAAKWNKHIENGKQRTPGYFLVEQFLVVIFPGGHIHSINLITPIAKDERVRAGTLNRLAE